MQHRYKHDIKNHKLDHEKIKKDSIFLRIINGIVSSLLISIPSWILGIILYNGLDKGYFYAPQKLKSAVKVSWSSNPFDYTVGVLLISIFFLLSLGILVLWVVSQIQLLKKPPVELPSIPEKFHK